jgi:hypothetical protein
MGMGEFRFVQGNERGAIVMIDPKWIIKELTFSMFLPPDLGI